MKPAHWKRTKRPPVVVGGHEFLSYQIGILRYALHCEAIDAVVERNDNSYTNTSHYGASAAGERVKSPRTGKPHRFTTERKAIEGAIAEAKRRQSEG